jgi:hypothetical protein
LPGQEIPASHSILTRILSKNMHHVKSNFNSLYIDKYL